MENDYNNLIKSIKAIIDKNCSLVGNLSNIASFIYHNISDLNWVGYYLIEGSNLVLNTFQGKPACNIIKLYNGVCGHAVKERKTIIVPNVLEFENHIVCDADSKSEIVVPIWKNNCIIGVLDIDSNIINRFNEKEKAFFEEVVRIVETLF